MTTNCNKTAYISKRCYFKFVYFDYDFLYPRIDTVVYLGNDLELKNKLPTEKGYLYFQDAESYVAHGFLNSQGHKLDEGEMSIMQVSETLAKRTIFDINGINHNLNEWENKWGY
jgi:hypothetical protein